MPTSESLAGCTLELSQGGHTHSRENIRSSNLQNAGHRHACCTVLHSELRSPQIVEARKAYHDAVTSRTLYMLGQIVTALPSRMAEGRRRIEDCVDGVCGDVSGILAQQEQGLMSRFF